MTPWEFLSHRKSTPSKLLGEPGPDHATLLEMLRIAVRVPDHGKLQPWRFVRVAGPARAVVGNKLAAITAARDPAAEPAALEKDRKRFSHAPLVVAVVARITPGHKVPAQEQLLSAGLAAYNLMLAAHARGFAAQWLTGWPTYDRAVGELFGLDANEQLIAFIHIGTPVDDVPERPRPDPAMLLRDVDA